MHSNVVLAYVLNCFFPERIFYVCKKSRLLGPLFWSQLSDSGDLPSCLKAEKRPQEGVRKSRLGGSPRPLLSSPWPALTTVALAHSCPRPATQWQTETDLLWFPWQLQASGGQQTEPQPTRQLVWRVLISLWTSKAEPPGTRGSNQGIEAGHTKCARTLLQSLHVCGWTHADPHSHTTLSHSSRDTCW